MISDKATLIYQQINPQSCIEILQSQKSCIMSNAWKLYWEYIRWFHFTIYKIDEESEFVKIYILANFTLCKYIYHSSTALTIVYLRVFKWKLNI